MLRRQFRWPLAAQCLIKGSPIGGPGEGIADAHAYQLLLHGLLGRDIQQQPDRPHGLLRGVAVEDPTAQREVTELGLPADPESHFSRSLLEE